MGRPVLWGMAVVAADGARGVLSIPDAELETAMALRGRTNLASVDASLLRLAVGQCLASHVLAAVTNVSFVADRPLFDRSELMYK